MVNVFTLLENTSNNDAYETKHGLSLYIETNKHKILFDLGPDDTFYHNAIKKGIDIKEVDIVVISHGHNDHAGGLPYFMNINKTAKIYIKSEAFNEHFSKGNSFYNDIGIDKLNIDKNRLYFVDDVLTIDDELTLFSNVTGRKYYSSMNDKLFSKENRKPMQQDKFEHEQYLVVSDNSNDFLFTGCSHNGVVNIVEKYGNIKQERKHALKCVIGGFHLFSPSTKEYESDDRIIDFAKWINSRKENYITCHCTGEKAYALLKENTNGKVTYLHCGDFIDLSK